MFNKHVIFYLKIVMLCLDRLIANLYVDKVANATIDMTYIRC
jgi:hypothetical protein